jgi:hypothetical protein
MAMQSGVAGRDPYLLHQAWPGRKRGESPKPRNDSQMPSRGSRQATMPFQLPAHGEWESGFPPHLGARCPSWCWWYQRIHLKPAEKRENLHLCPRKIGSYCKVGNPLSITPLLETLYAQILEKGLLSGSGERRCSVSRS